MGWYGTWNLEYTGNKNQKFLNTAKLVIANFKNRFEISDDGNKLEAVKRLSWYSADLDIRKILSYLDDGDQIHVLIDGETHPIRKVIREGGYVDKGVADENNYDYSFTDSTTGITTYHFQDEYIEPEYDYCEYEDQTFRKQDGKVTMECEYTDCDRYISNIHGMKDAFIYELAYSKEAKEAVLQGGFTDTLDTYIEWIAQEMGDNDEMLPIIQSFLNEIMDISREDVINENGRIDEEAFAHFNEIKSKFKTLESTKVFLTEVKSKLPPKEKETALELPPLFANMSKKDINELGGKKVLISLLQKEGEGNTRKILSMLGYSLNSESEWEKSSIEEANKRIKQSVIDYFLGCIKKKYPELTEENAKRFSDTLGREIDNKLEYGGFNNGFSVDYEPCSELTSAFYSMDLSSFNAPPIHNIFPWKTHVVFERGKYAKVSSQYGKSGILYMTDEYRQELLTSVMAKISVEEAKIPKKVEEVFEQEYQALIEALNTKREPLLREQEEIQSVLDQRKVLEDKAQQLIDTYATRIDELQSLGLSETEFEKRKQAILQEVQQAQKLADPNRILQQLGSIQEKYDWKDLKEFDETHKNELDKQAWMRKRYIQYGAEEYEKVWEKHRKEHPDYDDLTWPDTSGIPVDLDKLYAQKDEIDEYDREHNVKGKSEATPLEKEQEDFVAALGKAYAYYITHHGNIYESSFTPFQNGIEQLLANDFSKYFMNHYENLTNSAFLVDFENGVMNEIAKDFGFRKNYNFFDNYRSNLGLQDPHVKVSNGLVYSLDQLLDRAIIEYATPEAIQSQISSLNSRIKFMQDAKEESWNLKKIERQRDSFVSYQRQLQSKTKVEPSLTQLDDQKHFLEDLDEKATELLNQYDKDDNNPQVETAGIDFDD